MYTNFITNSHVIFHMWRRKHLVKYQRVGKYSDYGCRFQKWHSYVLFFHAKNILFWLDFACKKLSDDVQKIKIKQLIEYRAKHRNKWINK